MARLMAVSVISGKFDDPQNWIRRAVMTLAWWRANVSRTIFLRIQPEKSSLLAMRSWNVDGKLGNGIPFVRDNDFLPATNAHCPALFCSRKPCFGVSMVGRRNIVTFVDVLEIHGAEGNGVGCHDGAAGVCGLRLCMQLRWTCSMSSVAV